MTSIRIWVECQRSNLVVAFIPRPLRKDQLSRCVISASCCLKTDPGSHPSAVQCVQDIICALIEYEWQSTTEPRGCCWLTCSIGSIPVLFSVIEGETGTGCWVPQTSTDCRTGTLIETTTSHCWKKLCPRKTYMLLLLVPKGFPGSSFSSQMLPMLCSRPPS